MHTLRAFRSLLTLVAVAMAMGFPHRSHAQEEIFQRGNQRYQAQDYEGAIEAFEAVLAGGFESYQLHYNLGNAYFKAGYLGLSILSWERALRMDPGNQDAAANLALASNITVDDVEPLPRFWLLSVVSWWVDLIPRAGLVVSAALAWLGLGGTLVVRMLTRNPLVRTRAGRGALGLLVLVVTLGGNLMVRELGLGRAERGVILAEAVPVRAAPVEDDNQTLFQVHEGTRVRIDQRTDDWSEVVLDDGKVGWVPSDALGVI